MKLTICAAGLAALLCARPAMSQSTFTVDGTGTRVAHSDLPGITAWAVTPGFQMMRPWQSLGATGSYAQFPDGAWSLRGQAAGSAFSPSLRGFRVEAAGSLGGTLYQDQSRNGQYTSTLRLHWLGRSAGGWTGGSAGRAWNGAGWMGTRRAEVGAWVRRGVGSIALTLSPTAIGPDIRYADYEGALQVNSGALELVGSGGVRQWSGSASTWAMGSAAYWLNGHVALVASAGTYPADYAQGLPPGSYSSLGFRLATRRLRAAVPKLEAQLATSGGRRRGGPALTVRRHSAETTTLRIAAGAAANVEIMGDFTEWRPVALTRVRTGQWEVTLPISSGSHRMNIRVDGGAWDVPRGVAELNDEFSGLVGLLLIQ
jgi:hypothetical protein